MRPLWRTSIGLREKQHHVAVEQRKGSLPYEVGTRPSAPVLLAIGSRTSSISRERPRWIRSIAARWCAESCAAPPLQALATRFLPVQRRQCRSTAVSQMPRMG